MLNFTCPLEVDLALPIYNSLQHLLYRQEGKGERGKGERGKVGRLVHRIPFFPFFPLPLKRILPSKLPASAPSVPFPVKKLFAQGGKSELYKSAKNR